MHTDPPPAMAEATSDEGCSAWRPGVAPEIPAAFRAWQSFLQPAASADDAASAGLDAERSGLAVEEVVALRAERLVLHELIVRVTADIAVPEGAAEEDFGHNFRRMVQRVLDVDIAPHLPALVAAHAELLAQARALAGQVLQETVLAPPAPGRQGGSWWRKRWPRPAEARGESVVERDYRLVAAYKTAGLAATESLARAVYKGLYRVCGSLLARHGRVSGEAPWLARLVACQVGNDYGSQSIGRALAPWLAAAMAREGWRPALAVGEPVLISLKGASAAGKSSLRPMLQRLLADYGMAGAGHATVSPDVWRRLLLDYTALGPARKYAGHLTSRELAVIDGKLDRYIRHRAERDGGIPHMLVDRFRFDSFSSEEVGRVLHKTYARHVATMVMFFVVTPPEETVARGWQRALERGRYKAVEDFLGHAVEAYRGMPKIFFKWLAYQRPLYRYRFVDNRVPKGAFPTTIAEGTQQAMTIRDPLALVDIERYQKINIHAAAPEEVYPPPAELAAAHNLGFLREIVRRLPRVDFVDAAGVCYLRSEHGRLAVVDTAAWAAARVQPGLAEVLAALAPAPA